MRVPSISTLKDVTSYPRELRKLLKTTSMADLQVLIDSTRPFGKRSEFGEFSRTRAWQRACYHPPRLHELKMSMADELCETCGVEYIAEGHGSKSPAVEYCNAGDTYTATLLFVNGSYRVGCWGDIVERGNYD